MKKHVPVILQMETLECGAASLSMILAYYKKWIPLEQLRKDCGVSRDGSKATNILKAARDYGLEADGYKYELDEIKDIPLPAIVFWNFNHFVVLTGVTNKHVYINDPASGKVKLTYEQFSASFTGVVLCFEPTKEFFKSGKPAKIWNFAKARIKSSIPALAILLALGVAITLINVINPAISSIFVDEVISGSNNALLYPLIYVLLGAFALLVICQIVNAVIQTKVLGKMAIAEKAKYMWHTLRLPIDFYMQRKAGDIANRQNLNDTVAATLVTTLVPIVISSIMVIIYGIMMFIISPWLGLLSVGSIIIEMIVMVYVSKKRTEIVRLSQRDQGKLVGETYSGIEMIETIKSSGAESGFFLRWAGNQASYNSQMVKSYKLDNSIGFLPTLIIKLATAGVLILGVVLIINGALTAGLLVAFQAIFTSFVSPMNDILFAGSSLQTMRASMEKIDDVMRYKEDKNCAPSEMKLYTDEEDRKIRGHIVMSHVTFGYSKLGEALLHDFSLEVKPGERVAIVGLSGCGKSTIAKLLLGLYDPWEGEILYDGKPLSEIDKGVFKSSVAMVDQEITLFEDTVENNIKIWDDTIENFEVVLAAKDAQMHEDIVARKDGYKAMVLENGKNLSGGQKQRLEIASVLAKDPSIIVLDEATSALDAKTENQVVTAINERGITSIVIAHRLSTIRDCNKIIVLEKGRIIEQGTHEELLKLNGFYKRLIESE